MINYDKTALVLEGVSAGACNRKYPQLQKALSERNSVYNRTMDKELISRNGLYEDSLA